MILPPELRRLHDELASIAQRRPPEKVLGWTVCTACHCLFPYRDGGPRLCHRCDRAPEGLAQFALQDAFCDFGDGLPGQKEARDR